MISSELVFVQLAQVEGYICIVELSMMLEASVSQVRHQLKNLGDRVEHDDKDRWRIVKSTTINILSDAEKTERDELENTIQQAFWIAGNALKQLRDKRLYRSTHTTFEEYCRDRFDFSRAAAYYLIAATEVVENLKCQQIVDTNKSTILPTKESQCRPLAKLPPKQQQQAWNKAVEIAGNNKVPSARIVKEAIKRIENVDNKGSRDRQIQPSFKEVRYKAGLGNEYAVKLDEETFFRLKDYQDKIGTATKSGAIARLLDTIGE